MAGRRGEEKWELAHSALEERQEGLPTRFGASLVRVAVAAMVIVVARMMIRTVKKLKTLNLTSAMTKM